MLWAMMHQHLVGAVHDGLAMRNGLPSAALTRCNKAEMLIWATGLGIEIKSDITTRNITTSHGCAAAIIAELLNVPEEDQSFHNAVIWLYNFGLRDMLKKIITNASLTPPKDKGSMLYYVCAVMVVLGWDWKVDPQTQLSCVVIRKPADQSVRDAHSATLPSQDLPSHVDAVAQWQADAASDPTTIVLAVQLNGLLL
jgi:hypothetical protein